MELKEVLERQVEDAEKGREMTRTARRKLKKILVGQLKDVEESSKERIRALQDLMDFYRPDHPPTFSESILNMPLV